MDDSAMPIGGQAGAWRRLRPSLIGGAAACTAVAAGGVALALGSWPALVALASLCGAGVACAGWAGGRVRPHSPSPEGAETAPTALPAQVLPVWQRNVESARVHAERSMEGLVERFASILGQLEAALGTTAAAPRLELGATDELLSRHQAQLDDLLACTRAAMAMRAQALASIQGVNDMMGVMTNLAREVQTISRATHLLALNASVEATRAGENGGGFAAVAREVQALAQQSRTAGTQIARHVTQWQERLTALLAQAQREDCDDDEITLRAEETARRVLRAMIGSLAEASRASQELREVSRQVQGDIEGILMGLQSQDRFSQMLASVTSDMDRMNKWFKGAPDPAGDAPTLWLERLEASYTMEEMRSAHHGVAQIDRQAAVEFF